MHCKSYSHFFSKKFQHICISFDVNFNESLTNDVVSFEQVGPGVMINPQWLELLMSRTNSHGPKDVGAIEVRLYMVFYGFDVHQSLFALFF